MTRTLPPTLAAANALFAVVTLWLPTLSMPNGPTDHAAASLGIAAHAPLA